ncbi:MAG: hypothetical protein ACE5F6_08075 [Anaerolineae bacterium]
MEQDIQLGKRRHSFVWLLQAASGVLLVILILLHMIVQHFTAGELLTYEDVVAYLSNPVVFALETLFLITVTFHALAGVRSVALDLGLNDHQDRRLTRVLWVVGTLMVVYGIGITLYITT